VFKSRTIPRHLIKGVLGVGFLAIALIYGPTLGWWTLLPLALAFASFRGCPMCWTIGLIETVLHRHIDGPEGSCELRLRQ
jgi:hypothetical protein